MKRELSTARGKKRGTKRMWPENPATFFSFWFRALIPSAPRRRDAIHPGIGNQLAQVFIGMTQRY